MTHNPPQSVGHSSKIQTMGVLVGEWKTVGTHPLVPGKTFHGRSSFEWFEDGAFIIMHSEIDEPEIPTGTAIYGYDDGSDEGTVLYHDERGVSRMYQWTFADNELRSWRNSEGFSQRSTHTIAPDGNAIVSKGEYSRDGVTWEGDLELTYTRVK